MCKCNPQIRTPFCGAIGCEWPLGLFERCELTEQEVSKISELTEQEVSKISEVKFREFWVGWYETNGNCFVDDTKNPISKVQWHVIEYCALTAKDAEIERLKSELADKDAVLERVRHHVVGFKSTSEILNEIDEVLQKYRKSEG